MGSLKGCVILSKIVTIREDFDFQNNEFVSTALQLKLKKIFFYVAEHMVKKSVISKDSKSMIMKFL